MNFVILHLFVLRHIIFVSQQIVDRVCTTPDKPKNTISSYERVGHFERLIVGFCYIGLSVFFNCEILMVMCEVVYAPHFFKNVILSTIFTSYFVSVKS